MTSGEEDSNFGQETKHRLVEDFATAYLNGSMKPNLAERNPTDGHAIEYLMDGPEFGRLNRRDVWSYSNAPGTAYQYRVTYKDKRFSDLEDLLGRYSASARVDGDDMPRVEQNLYELILVLIKEGRLPKNFKIQSARDPRLDKVVVELEQLRQLMKEIDERVRRLEHQIEINDGTPLFAQSNPIS